MASRHQLAGLVALGAVLIAGVVFALSVWVADLPDEAGGTVLAVFPFQADPESNLVAILAAGGRPIRDPVPGRVWIASGPETGFAGMLRRQGAVLVFDERWPFGPTLAGCAAFLPVPGAPPPVAQRLDWMR